jgi:hypothetical protein
MPTPRLEYSRPNTVYQLAMTRTNALLIALALFLGGLVLYANKDWFTRPPIQISHRFDAFEGRFAQSSGTVPLLFEFNRPLKLTSVKVFALDALQTNKSPQPIWQLVSDSSSAPTRGFLYGTVIPGMRTKNQAPGTDSLGLGVQYRLQIEAGSLKAQHDFILEPATP